MGSANGEAEAIVRTQVSDPILAEGWFHVAADVQLSGSPVIDAFRLPVEWLLKRRAWKLPAHSYWVMTPRHLHIFELRFGTETRLRRTIGTWDRADVTASSAAEPNSVRVNLPGVGRAVTVQGDRFAPGEAEVIRLLTNS